ncbi:hypothetical protein QWI17_15230 [Gilvimarinus sp. SDUM040013]|uniref:Uncharacterized protein n=1 Tax=Gilvimarinus gilvus TaxID=3058038 RepID=A0ABU4S2Q9_9GAMM|nr:hypothetical protein [Gilvimarinus sp. SDUM040013]MDO3387194.1 hypothetical protein [Gilvimarinus sp. SDUM040013]MDX6850757.1 hypothetical protein [Gilvimarinus sp. SDUM040013]
MSEEGKSESEELAKKPNYFKWALSAYLAIIVIYAGYFWGWERYGVSDDPNVWGTFGDFVGGVVNPVLGLITILLLTTTIRQTDKALAQADDALRQSREELKLTREEMKRGLEIQQATERALNEQIKQAEMKNSFEMAIALCGQLYREVDSLERDIESTRGDIKNSALQKQKLLEDRIRTISAAISKWEDLIMYKLQPGTE